MQILPAGLEGLQRAEAAFERSASRIAHAAAAVQIQPVEDRVDLSQAFVDLMQARNQFSANAVSVRTGDQMARQVIDLLG